ncbi:hypothetical protein U1Q18_047605 [Sarracenia purpurea var. burkii]
MKVRCWVVIWWLPVGGVEQLACGPESESRSGPSASAITWLAWLIGLLDLCPSIGLVGYSAHQYGILGKNKCCPVRDVVLVQRWCVFWRIGLFWVLDAGHCLLKSKLGIPDPNLYKVPRFGFDSVRSLGLFFLVTIIK